MSWDWQVFCQDTITQEVGQSCFGKNGDITYLDWMLSAWGWTISVSLLSLVIDQHGPAFERGRRAPCNGSVVAQLGPQRAAGQVRCGIGQGRCLRCY